ncbi:MAG: ABC transporter permease, partial [Solirubrobacteraceae bacterium]
MLGQVVAVTAMSLRSIPGRLASSVVVVIGVAGVVGVLVSVMAMATGLAAMMGGTGSPTRAIVLHKAATSEGFSNVDVSALGTIADAPGVDRTPSGTAAVSPEYVAAVDLPTRSGSEAGITIRGTGAAGFVVHPEWHIVAGRRFRPGRREIVVGAAAAAEFPSLALGRHVELGNADWTVIGRFTSGGDAHESEILADLPTLMAAFGWGAYSAVTVRLTSPAVFPAFRQAIVSNPSLDLDAMREQTYYGQQSKGVASLLFLVSDVVGVIMAIGAVLAALNTMYSAVAARRTEIATLRAIGFGAGSVAASVLVEAVVLS